MICIVRKFSINNMGAAGENFGIQDVLWSRTCLLWIKIRKSPLYILSPPFLITPPFLNSGKRSPPFINETKIFHSPLYQGGGAETMITLILNLRRSN